MSDPGLWTRVDGGVLGPLVVSSGLRLPPSSRHRVKADAYARPCDAPRMDARARFFAAKEDGDPGAAAAALHELAPGELDDELVLELLALADTSDLRARRELEERIGAVVVTRSAQPADDLFWMLLERWSDSSDFGPQRACDVSSAVLARAPGEQRALEVYVAGALRDEPYLHRGLDLESVAAKAPPRDAAVLLVAQAHIRRAVDGAPERARLLLERARVLDPAVDLAAVRALCLRAMRLPAGTSSEEQDEALPPLEPA